MNINLKSLAVGDCGKITGFEKTGKAYRKRLLAMGLTPAEHHVAVDEVTSTGFDPAHRFIQPWIALGRREHQQWARLPQIVTEFRGRGLGRRERSADAREDDGECACDELPRRGKPDHSDT